MWFRWNQIILHIPSKILLIQFDSSIPEITSLKLFLTIALYFSWGGGVFGERVQTSLDSDSVKMWFTSQETRKRQLWAAQFSSGWLQYVRLYVWFLLRMCIYLTVRVRERVCECACKSATRLTGKLGWNLWHRSTCIPYDESESGKRDNNSSASSFYYKHRVQQHTLIVIIR